MLKTRRVINELTLPNTDKVLDVAKREKHIIENHRKALTISI